MRHVEFARQHLLLVGAALGAVLGVVVGVFLPIQAAPPMRGEALEWTLPTQQSVSRFDMAQYEALKTAGFWNTQSAGRGAATGWTLRAIMSRPIAQVAVGTSGKNEQKWVPLGGTLPDGAILAAIERDAIWYELEGCRRMKRLYAATDKKTPAAAVGQPACAGDPSPAKAAPAAPSAPDARPEPAGATPSNGK